MTEMLTDALLSMRNGNVIDGDLILYVCGKYLMENGQPEWMIPSLQL